MARKYARDNRGRFASKGTGATARGGRLKTAGGNKREGQTIKAAGGPAGTVGKPRGLKPGAIKAKASTSSKLEFSRAAALRRYDRADVNVQKYESKGDAFKAHRARLARDSYAAANRATRGNEASQRNLYQAQTRYATISNPKTSRRPIAAKGRTIGHSEAYRLRNEAQLRRGVETGRRAQQFLADKGAYQAPLGSKLSVAHGKAQRVEWASRNEFNARANRKMNSKRSQWERR